MKNLLMALACFMLIIPIASAAEIGVTPDTINLDMYSGETKTVNLSVVWNGDAPITAFTKYTVYQSGLDWDGMGMDVSFINPVILYPNVPKAVPIIFITAPNLVPDNYSIHIEFEASAPLSTVGINPSQTSYTLMRVKCNNHTSNQTTPINISQPIPPSYRGGGGMGDSINITDICTLNSCNSNTSDNTTEEPPQKGLFETIFAWEITHPLSILVVILIFLIILLYRYRHKFKRKKKVEE